MAQINQKLIERLCEKLSVGKRAVYERIQAVVSRTHLERNIAALALARENGISIDRFSTAEERSQLRTLGGISYDRGPAPHRDEEHASIAPALRKQSSANKKVKPPSRSVFVIHGRDSSLNESVYGFIRSLGIEVIEWNHALKVASRGNANPYIGDIIEKVMSRAGALVVLLSPEDEVELHADLVQNSERKTEGKVQLQARPNVLFEAGLALGAHPRKTILVQVGTIKSFSDVAGMHIQRLSNSTSSRNLFANKLESVLGAVDRTGNTWMQTGNFEVKRKPKIVKR